MTPLVTAHGGQDWTGFAVVMGICVALSAVAYLDALRAARRARCRMQLVDDANTAVTETDHIGCVHPGCDQALCYCRNLDAPCAGTVVPGCSHSGAFVCGEHRLEECEGCREDVRDDAGIWR